MLYTLIAYAADFVYCLGLGFENENVWLCISLLSKEWLYDLLWYWFDYYILDIFYLAIFIEFARIFYYEYVVFYKFPIR